MKSEPAPASLVPFEADLGLQGEQDEPPDEQGGRVEESFGRLAGGEGDSPLHVAGPIGRGVGKGRSRSTIVPANSQYRPPPGCHPGGIFPPKQPATQKPTRSLKSWNASPPDGANEPTRASPNAATGTTSRSRNQNTRPATTTHDPAANTGTRTDPTKWHCARKSLAERRGLRRPHDRWTKSLRN